MTDTQAMHELETWFLALFASRTPPKSVEDALPEYRVRWSEIAVKARELGMQDDLPSLRKKWCIRFNTHTCNRCVALMKQAGETRRFPRMTAAEAANLQE